MTNLNFKVVFLDFTYYDVIGKYESYYDYGIALELKCWDLLSSVVISIVYVMTMALNPIYVCAH